MDTAITRGLGAGAVGTLGVQLMERWERQRLGRPPLFAPAELAGRLSRVWLHRRLSREERDRVGRLLRWSYGPAWGAAAGLLPARWRRSPVLLGLGLGKALGLFEWFVLPAVRATPPVRRWSLQEHLFLGAQTLVFGLITAAILKRST